LNKTAVVIGVLLIAVGLFGYFTAGSEERDTAGEVIEKTASPTALIPAGFGAVMLYFGVYSLARPSYNKLAMHCAAGVALLGLLAAAGRIAMTLAKLIRDTGEFNPRAFTYLAIMGLLCSVFLVFCIMSFRRARRARAGS
jgi:hypothetical protein